VLPEVIIEECKDGKVRDPVTGQCVLPTKTGLDCKPGFVPNEAGTECIPEVTIEACKDGKVRDPITGQCVLPEVTIEECKDGKVRDPISGLCVLPKTGLDCKPGFVPNEAGTECIPEVTVEACKDGKVRDPISGLCVLPPTGLDCKPGFVPNEAGTECIPEVTVEACKDGKVRDPVTGQCVLPTVDCLPGFHDDGTGFCVADDDEECKPGFERIGGECVPVCKEGYLRNLETGQCEKDEDKGCPPAQVKDANGKCVPITKTVECQPGYEKVNGVCVPVCKPGYKRVNGVCVPTTQTPSVYSPSSVSGEGERTDPIYAGGMDDFDLFATLEELLADKPDKTDKKKDNKKSKDKTKMATGGHLDDLLAEQMTVDDLLKLLR
jgi:hypothetical protein